MSTFLKFVERDPCDQMFYSIQSIYIREQDRRKAVVALDRMAKFTTQPDIEIRYTK